MMKHDATSCLFSYAVPAAAPGVLLIGAVPGQCIRVSYYPKVHYMHRYLTLSCICKSSTCLSLSAEFIQLSGRRVGTIATLIRWCWYIHYLHGLVTLMNTPVTRAPPVLPPAPFPNPPTVPQTTQQEAEVTRCILWLAARSSQDLIVIGCSYRPLLTTMARRPERQAGAALPFTLAFHFTKIAKGGYRVQYIKGTRYPHCSLT
jgi:hypothetical protein